MLSGVVRAHISCFRYQTTKYTIPVCALIFLQATLATLERASLMRDQYQLSHLPHFQMQFTIDLAARWDDETVPNWG